MKEKIIFSLIFVLFLGQASRAQIADPVKWEFYTKRVSGERTDLYFKAVIEENWHMYGHDIPEGGPVPTRFDFKDTGPARLLGPIEALSEARVKYDPSFDMELRLFDHRALFRQKLEHDPGSSFSVAGILEYMCCDDHQCLPPREVKFSFRIGEDNPAPGSHEMKTGTEKKSLLLFFMISFVAGFAGILTPCVFPMIPMTVTFFMRGSENRMRAIIKGLIFGFSIVLIYTLVGFLVSLTSIGADFTNQLGTHWIPNILFFLLFMVFAASFLGMFEIVLPGRWVKKADQQADRGGYWGAFFMGLTLVLVSFSCTGPIIGALLVESAGGLALKPILGMFGFSLAFALPFTLLSIFPSWLNALPKSGGWLNTVKVFVGFVLLALGLKFLSVVDQSYHLGLLSREVFLAAWIVIFSMSGFYLLGKLKLPHDSDLPHVGVGRLISSMIVFVFVLYMVPGLFGAPLRAIAPLIPPKSAQVFDLTGTRSRVLERGGIPGEGNAVCGVPSYAGFLELPYGLEGYFVYEEGMACAKELNKPVLLDFKGHACANCKEMEARVWSDPLVLEKLKKYLIIALYTDDRTKLPEEEWIRSSHDGKLKKTLGKKNLSLEITRFGTNTQPLYVLLDHDGDTLVFPMGHTLDVERFIGFLDRGLQRFYDGKSLKTADG